MQLGHLSEIILYVRDMAAQVAFYRDVLGQEVTYPAGLADYSVEHWVTFATGACTLALHSGGQPPTGTPPRFGFHTADAVATRTALLHLGVSIDALRSPAPGVFVCDARDPEGNGFFIEQRDR
jgi:catechol 2,3-dioxygenase-like lactoylglutathione lyase family enzyme